jgi:hypothetical protein
MRHKTIHDYEPEEVIAQEVQDLLQGDCNPFDLSNFIDAATDALNEINNKAALAQALKHCDTAEIGRIVVNAIEDHYQNLAEFFADKRYYNHELDHKYEE